MGKLYLTSSFFVVAPMISRMLNDGQKDKKVMFITTAAEGEEGDKWWLENDRNALKDIGLQPVEYTLSGKKEKDFKKDFEGIQYVFLSGGNAFYLLEKAQQSGFVPFITDFMQKEESIYFGSSAGSIIAGEDIYPLRYLDDPDKAPNVKGYKGFGLVDLVILPHWGSEHFKQHYLSNELESIYTGAYKMLPLSDDEFLYTEDGNSIQLLKSQ